jgi:hypothetical protein
VGSQIRRSDAKKAVSLQWQYRPRQSIQLKVHLSVPWIGDGAAGPQAICILPCSFTAAYLSTSQLQTMLRN